MSTELADEFREISGLSGYRISRSGSIQSDHVRGSHDSRRDGNWKDLKVTAQKKGHLFINIRGKKHYIHRLVLLTFLGPCPEGMECLHGDGNPANNDIGNLRWGTSKENADDMLRHGTRPMGERHCCATLTEEQVRSIRQLHAGGMTVARISRNFGRNSQTISKIVRGESWKHCLQESYQ